MAAKKYYTVWIGVNPGVYDNWASVKHQIQGYPNAKYKSFKTKHEAEVAAKRHWNEYYETREKLIVAKKTTSFNSMSERHYKLPAWAVDAACSSPPGPTEYRGVNLATGEQLFHQGPFPDGTNNIGEFLAIVHALAQLDKSGDVTTAVYTDSKTAIAWIRQKHAKTTLKKNPRNAPLFEIIKRAELWLQTHPDFKNPILKWETEAWGEIPADFGRK